MRTAIISDLHLGSRSREDVLRDPSVRRTLLEGIEGADRVVLLGDTIEMRGLPLADALDAARPFFEELGEAMAGGAVLMLAGNHDHRLAEPLLDQRSLAEPPALALEARYAPGTGAASRLARWLGSAELEMSYPGAWLRDDVYAMHGHYMDCHLTIPRAECIGGAAVARATRPLPDPATPDDYERLLRPFYGLVFGLAQSGASRASGGSARLSERAWKWIADGGDDDSRRRRIASAAVSRAAVPAAVWALNRALGTGFDPDLSAGAISAASVAGASEAARRLKIDAAHVIVGHSHRAGPREGEGPWPLPGGGRLHNTGNWVFASVLHRPGSKPGPYWPGTVTWLEDDDAPRRVSLLTDRSSGELAAIGGRGGRLRLSSLATRQVG